MPAKCPAGHEGTIENMTVYQEDLIFKGSPEGGMTTVTASLVCTTCRKKYVASWEAYVRAEDLE